MHPKLLVIIVTYNAMPWIDRCLSSVAGSSVPSRVLVVDNGSQDGTCQHVASGYPWAELVERPDNIGFGAANNIGLRKAVDEGFDFVYLLNQDAWVEPDTFERLIAAWDDGLAVLSPVQRNAGGGMDANFERKCGRFLSRCEGDLCRMPFVMAAHWLMSVDAVRRIGGFSPVFRQYGEDDNYLDRARYHGLGAAVLKSASAVHDRADRPDPKDRRMRLKCIATVVKCSDPSCLPFLRKTRELLELAGMSVKNRSLIPLGYIPVLIRRFPEIDDARSLSRGEGAFL